MQQPGVFCSTTMPGMSLSCQSAPANPLHNGLQGLLDLVHQRQLRDRPAVDAQLHRHLVGLPQPGLQVRCCPFPRPLPLFLSHDFGSVLEATAVTPAAVHDCASHLCASSSAAHRLTAVSSVLCRAFNAGWYFDFTLAYVGAGFITPLAVRTWSWSKLAYTDAGQADASMFTFAQRRGCPQTKACSSKVCK